MKRIKKNCKKNASERYQNLSKEKKGKKEQQHRQKSYKNLSKKYYRMTKNA